MNPRSLESVITDMARRADAIIGTGHGKGRIRDGMGDDMGPALDALLATDPLFAGLYKEYLEARSRCAKLAQKHGSGDPMADVAADMLDSACSAMQTRLIELQEQWQGGTGEGAAVFEQAKRRFAEKRANEAAAVVRLKREKRIRDKQRESDMFFWILMLSWIMNHTIAATKRTLSAAHDFALVSPAYDKRASCA